MKRKSTPGAGISRRNFFKIGGAGLAGLTLPGLSILGPRKAYSYGYSSKAWKFGVMADTQWKAGTGAPGSDEDLYACAGHIIDALNTQFIKAGCKFVIQVGDMVDTESHGGNRCLPARAAHAQALYKANIGFFPLRGNHEASRHAATEFQTLFPQAQGTGPHLNGAKILGSPSIGGLAGLSYAFDYLGVRCILLDQFTRADGSNYDNDAGNHNNVLDQLTWVDGLLSGKAQSGHAFVFAHKNLVGQDHKDVLFGADEATSNLPQRDAFIQSCQANGVRYVLGGHDHMHHRSIVHTQDGGHRVGQIICSSNSYKFYTPAVPDPVVESPIAQELYTIGFYIFTVDGPRVTVDFYSTSNGGNYGTSDLTDPPPSFVSPHTPTFHLRERFGYSLNGRQWEVARGASYAGITDTCLGTTAKILTGANGDTGTDKLERALEKTVTTGWSDPVAADNAASRILSLWGLNTNLSLFHSASQPLPTAAASLACDTYALSLTCNLAKVSQPDSGQLALSARDPQNGLWTNAVNLNTGGVKSFKFGPWQSSYGLGTYGVDPSTSSVWAVVNHQTDFVAKVQ